MWWLLWEVCFENNIKGGGEGEIPLEESVSWKVRSPNQRVQCSLAVVGGIRVTSEKDMEDPVRKKLGPYETKPECVSYSPLRDTLQGASLALPGVSTAKLRVLPGRRHLQLLWLGNGAAPPGDNLPEQPHPANDSAWQENG